MFSSHEYSDMLFLYAECGKNARATAAEYGRRYPHRAHPSWKVILGVVNRLRTTGNVFAERREIGGAPRNARTVHNQERILQSFNRDPEQSIRRMARRTNLSYSTVQRTLRENRMHAYHFIRVQNLLPEDYAPRLQFCTWLLQKNAEDPDFLTRILFCDESLFCREGTFNFHNYHIWANQNPRAFSCRRFQHRFGINLWAGILGNHVIGPFELPARLTGDDYLRFLDRQLPHLLDDVPLLYQVNDWFQHDGAPPHFALRVRQLLDLRYGRRWIGRGGPIHWPARSPDLTPLDFFLWGHIKNHVYATPVNTRQELENRIHQAFTTISPEMLANARNSLIRRARLCLQMNGGHFQHLL